MKKRLFLFILFFLFLVFVVVFFYNMGKKEYSGESQEVEKIILTSYWEGGRPSLSRSKSPFRCFRSIETYDFNKNEYFLERREEFCHSLYLIRPLGFTLGSKKISSESRRLNDTDVKDIYTKLQHYNVLSWEESYVDHGFSGGKHYWTLNVLFDNGEVFRTQGLNHKPEGYLQFVNFLDSLKGYLLF